MEMPEYKELSKDIADVKVTVERIETTLKLQGEPMKGFMKDLNRRMTQQDDRMDKLEAKMERFDDDLDIIRVQPHKDKSRWYDRVLEYLVIAALGFLLVRAGIK